MSEVAPEVAARVLVTERMPLAQHTLNGLLDVVKASFRSEHRVTSLTYRRGEDVLVERQVPVDRPQEEEGPDFTTPYESVRQRATIRLFEDGEFSPLERLCRAAMLLHENKMPATGIVVRSTGRLTKWLGGIQIDQVLRIPLYEDPDAPAGRVFVCGSLFGTLIADVEYAVVCRME